MSDTPIPAGANALQEQAPASRRRPRSAVSAGVGIVGLIGLLGYLLIARHAPDIAAFLGVDWGNRGPMSGPNSAIVSVLACGVPMVLWSLFVDTVHRNPSTGIDWSLRRPWRETVDISLTKIAGLWTTWALIAGSARTWFARSPRRLAAVRGTGGVMMIGLGGVLLLADNKG